MRSPAYFIMLFSLAVVAPAALSQSWQEGHLLDNPVKIVPLSRVAPEMGEVWVETLVPLGFSPNSRFAYLVVYASWGCATCSELKIIDLKSDKELFAEEYMIPEGTLRDYVAQFHGPISAILKRYGIRLGMKLDVKKFPLRSASDVLDAVLRKTSIFSGQDSLEDGAINERIEVSLRSPHRGEKLVSRLERRSILDPNIDTIEGYIESPFEPRIVLIASGLQYVLDGDWMVRFHVAGAGVGPKFR